MTKSKLRYTETYNLTYDVVVMAKCREERCPVGYVPRVGGVKLVGLSMTAIWGNDRLPSTFFLYSSFTYSAV